MRERRSRRLASSLHEEGAIHSHGVGYSDTPVDSDIDAVLAKFAIESHVALTDLDREIQENFTPSPDDDPTDIKGEEGLEARLSLLRKTARGRLVVADFESKLEAIKKEAGDSVTHLMELHFGASAIHPGRAPGDWREPGGTQRSAYRSTDPEMQSREQVLESNVLKEFKFCQELQLFQRRVNLTNMCYDHSCSTYCLREEVIHSRYEEEKHGPPTKLNPNILSLYDAMAGDHASHTLPLATAVLF